MSQDNDEIKRHFKQAFATTFAGLKIVKMPVIAFNGVIYNFRAKDDTGKTYHFFYVLNPVAQRLVIKCRALGKTYRHYYGVKAGQPIRKAKPTPPDEARAHLAAIRKTLEKNP
ncbi:hypothetical protein [Thiomicrorhabdus xiamenensis]|uniref:Uncharacterized protein n=1 Tax=Thiomicrorhabdus xiamenensis TaxID=2739063 RepID=A0A7D4NLI5_9GAMM|nr:hypothetical protein [Thiomicrorhabdus xiamenensis]QKI89214.1 hypothetical protein HQN79_06375 [Thiomicrorhabdus xiamenensis]